MATRYWQPVNGDTTDVNNWSATRGGATGASVPGSSDTAWFYDGAIDVNANTSFAPLICNIGGKFTGNINGLLFSTAACVVTVESVAQGKTIVIGPAASTTLAKIHVRRTGAGNVQIAGGSSSLLTDLWSGAFARVLVLASCPVTNGIHLANTVTYEANATALTSCAVRGNGSPSTASATFDRSATTLTVTHGASTLFRYTAAITTLNVEGANHVHDSSGTIATANAYPGGNLLPSSTAFAVTNSNFYEGGSLSYGSGKITFTNPPAAIGDVL